MKKLTFILIVTLSVLGTICHAKEDKKITKGFRVGFNSSLYYEDGNKLDDSKRYGGFYIGGYGESRIIPLLRYGSGIEYRLNGVNLDKGNKINYHYLNVPLYLKAKVGPVFALTGVAPGLKITESKSLKVIDPFNNEKARRLDVPLFIGCGFKFLMISVDARYNWGLIEIYDEVKSQYLQIGASVYF